MANEDLRTSASAKGVKLWKIAEALQVNDGNFSRMLRKELPAEKKNEIMQIIDRIASEERKA